MALCCDSSVPITFLAAGAINVSHCRRITCSSKSKEYDADRTRKELYATGKRLRGKCPRKSHAGWKPAPNRPDTVDLVLSSEKGRIEELLPLRHGRMVQS